MNNQNDPKPDVEELLKEIRAHVKDAEDAVPEAFRNAVNDEDNLHQHLDQANSACASANAIAGDVMPRWRSFLLKPFIVWRYEISSFNGSMVRVLNRVVKLLEGHDLPESGSMIDNQKRRLTLMEKMSDRLQELEARVKELEENRKG